RRRPDAVGAPSAPRCRSRSLSRRDGHRVGDRADHAPELRAVLLDDGVADPLQAQAAHRLTVHVLGTDGRPHLGHLQTGHHAPAFWARAAARTRSMSAGATSSTALPRRAATASGCSRPLRAATVACTMLIALSEPSDLLSTSWMPAHSRTA